MAHQYTVKKKKFTTKEGVVKQEYFATSKSIRVIGVDEMAEIITQNTSLTGAVVVGAVNAVSKVIKDSLASGFKVKLDGIGIFGVSLSSEGAEKESDLNPKKVFFKKVTYKADSKLVRALRDMKYVKEKSAPKGAVTSKKTR